VAEGSAVSVARPSIQIQGAVKSFDGRVVVDVADLTLGRHPIGGPDRPTGPGRPP